MFRSVLILLLLGLGSNCAAQECRVESRTTICVAGFCKQSGGAGNGVYVARNDDNSASMVATAAHVLDGGDRSARVESVTVDGTPAQILGRWNDGSTDLALLRVSGPADGVAIHATEIPPAGTAIRMIGIVDGRVATHTGTLIDSERRRGQYGGGSGFSGSGIYGPENRLLGIHNGKTTGEDGSWYRKFTSIRRLDQFVSQYAPDLKTGRELAIKGVAVAAATPSPTTLQGTGAGASGDAGGDWKPSKADNGDAEPDAAADSSSSLVDKGKKIVGAAADAATDVVAGTAEGVGDSIGPGAIGAFAKGGWPALGAYVVGHAGYAILQRRRRRRQSDAESSASGKSPEKPIVDSGASSSGLRPKSQLDPPTPPPAPPAVPVAPPAAVAIPAEIPGLSELQKQVADLTAKLELRETIAQDSDELARKVSSNLEGLLVGEMIGRDGKPTGETSLWQNGVRLAKEGGLSVQVLGGKLVAAEIEKHVQAQAAKAAGTSL